MNPRPMIVGEIDEDFRRQSKKAMDKWCTFKRIAELDKLHTLERSLHEVQSNLKERILENEKLSSENKKRRDQLRSSSLELKEFTKRSKVQKETIAGLQNALEALKHDLHRFMERDDLNQDDKEALIRGIFGTQTSRVRAMSNQLVEATEGMTFAKSFLASLHAPTTDRLSRKRNIPSPDIEPKSSKVRRIAEASASQKKNWKK